MRVEPKKRPTSWLSLLLICSVLGTLAGYIVYGLRQSATIYDSIAIELQKPAYAGSVKKVSFPKSNTELNIASWDAFTPGNIWTYVSFRAPLPNTFAPSDLVTVDLPQGDAGTTMQISSKIDAQLKNLFAAADENGRPLMISSAYRSIEDQQALYDEFVEARGLAAADMYVADPGSSEHHTGLAIDLSDRSDSCAADSDRCLISPDTSQWLADNVHTYGFIVRYPEGAQPITGVAYEPWHYRYVGVALATKLYESGLTFDEALRQIRPASSNP